MPARPFRCASVSGKERRPGFPLPRSKYNTDLQFLLLSGIFTITALPEGYRPGFPYSCTVFSFRKLFFSNSPTLLIIPSQILLSDGSAFPCPDGQDVPPKEKTVSFFFYRKRCLCQNFFSTVPEYTPKGLP